MNRLITELGAPDENGLMTIDRFGGTIIHQATA
jgi:hypothetical protein